MRKRQTKKTKPKRQKNTHTHTQKKQKKKKQNKKPITFIDRPFIPQDACLHCSKDFNFISLIITLHCFRRNKFRSETDTCLEAHPLLRLRARATDCPISRVLSASSSIQSQRVACTISCLSNNGIYVERKCRLECKSILRPSSELKELSA